MFVIFGIKRLRRRLATIFAICAQCRTPAAQVITRVSTWFSLFFIPVIPLGNKYFTTCTLCGRSMKVDKANALQLVASAQEASAAEPNGSQPRVLPPSAEASNSPTES